MAAKSLFQKLFGFRSTRAGTPRRSAAGRDSKRRGADRRLVLESLELVSDFVAMGKSHRRSDVSRDEDLVVSGDDAAGTSAVAGSAFGDRPADFHEIFVPAWPGVALSGIGIHPEPPL